MNMIKLHQDYPVCFACDGILTPLPRAGGDTHDLYLCSRCVILTDSRDPSAYAIPGPHGTHWRWHAREEEVEENFPGTDPSQNGPATGTSAD